MASSINIIYLYRNYLLLKKREVFIKSPLVEMEKDCTLESTN